MTTQATLGQSNGRPVPQRTGAQVVTAVSSLDGTLTKPRGEGDAWYRKVREMRRDPTVRMARRFLVAALVSGQWSYEATDAAPLGARELVSDEMEKHRLQLLGTTLRGLIDYGWQGYELVWGDRPDGLWGLSWAKPLLHDMTEILVDERTGAFAGLRQPHERLRLVRDVVDVDTSSDVDLMPEECVLLSHEPEGTNWHGEPAMKSVELVYDEQAGITKQAKKYDAKVAGSHWVVYYPLGVSRWNGVETDNGVIARDLVRGIEAMGGIALPRSVVQAVDALTAQAASLEALQWKIELMSDAGRGQTPFVDRLKYLDVLKVRALGFPERALLEGQFGTKAEAEAHADLAILNLEMLHLEVTCAYNEQLVDPMLEVDFGAESRGSVYVRPAPLADRAKALLSEVYKLILASPEGSQQEMAAMDVQAVRERLDVPTQPQTAYQEDVQALDEYQQDLLTAPEDLGQAEDQDAQGYQV